MRTEHGDGGEDLSALLQELGVHIDYPATPPLASVVRRRLAERSVATHVRGFAPLSPAGLSRVAAVIAILLGIALAASPGARAAVTGWFAVPGIDLRSGSPSHVALGHGLQLGRPVTLAEARRKVPFPISVPTAPGLKIPDAIYLANSDAGKIVSLVYHSRPGIPAARATHVALLITELRAQADTVYFTKFFNGRWPRRLYLGGSRGYWIPAAWIPSGHLLVPYLSGGQAGTRHFYAGDARLAANTLLWQDGDVSLRLESSLSPASAARIARSMR